MNTKETKADEQDPDLFRIETDFQHMQKYGKLNYKSNEQMCDESNMVNEIAIA